MKGASQTGLGERFGLFHHSKSSIASETVRELSEPSTHPGFGINEEKAYLELNARFNEDVLRTRDLLESIRTTDSNQRPSLVKSSIASYAMNLPVILKTKHNCMFLLNNNKLDPQQMSLHKFLEKNFDSENNFVTNRNQMTSMAPRRRRRGTVKLLKATKQ